MKLQDLIDAAQVHGEEVEPDSEIGDLIDYLSAFWTVMTDEQKALAYAKAVETAGAGEWLEMASARRVGAITHTDAVVKTGAETWLAEAGVKWPPGDSSMRTNEGEDVGE